MRGLLYFVSIVMVVALAYWAYYEGYQTRQIAREVKQLQRELGAAHEELSVVRAEWAYLNRPDRLRILHEMNFERLGLMEISAQQFGTVTQISYPPSSGAPSGDPLANLDPNSAVDTVGQIETLVGPASPAATMIQPEPYKPEPESLP